MSEALDELVERLHAPGLDFVTLALKVSRRTGAPLSDVLGEAARLVRERVELRRKLDVRTAQVRMSARLVAGMPVAMVAFLAAASSDFREGIATVPGAASIAVDVRTAQVRMSARLVAGMPVAMVAFLAAASSDFREGIATVPGAASIAVALLLDGIAWSIIRAVMRSIC